MTLSVGSQPPQAVPALVHFLISAKVLQVPSLIFSVICPFETFLQEQIWVSSGKRSISSPSSPGLLIISSEGDNGNGFLDLAKAENFV
ncbi:unnamed protein product [[Candida] boidinii]|nr:unnamed protein product [[Candida] boidinii]